MNKVVLFLIGLFILISAVLFFVFNKDNLPKFGFPTAKTTPQALNSTQIFKGKITRIIPLDNTKLRIELDISTPQIIASKDRGIAKLSKTGQLEKLLTADKLKAADTVEVKMSYDSQTKSYSLESIYLIE